MSYCICEDTDNSDNYLYICVCKYSNSERVCLFVNLYMQTLFPFTTKYAMSLSAKRIAHKIQNRHSAYQYTYVKQC